jgi:hypothetical protein
MQTTDNARTVQRPAIYHADHHEQRQCTRSARAAYNACALRSALDFLFFIFSFSRNCVHLLLAFKKIY